MSIFNNNLLAGAASQSTTTPVHTINQSIRFNDDDSANMTRTFGSGNQKIWTMSFWVKRANLGTGQRIISRRTGGGSTTATMGFRVTTDQFDFYDPSNGGELITDAVFRDTSAWYNFVISYEASNSIQSERLRIYVNGTRQTFTSSVAISDANGNFNAAVTHAIGKYQYNNSEYLDAYLAEIVWIDGTALDPSSFGLYNDSNIWIPKDVSGLTFGTNGFHIKGEDSSDLGNDSSGNDNDFSTSGLAAHDQVSDSPTNNFCVMSPLDKTSTFSTSEGNLKTSLGSAGSTHGIKGTIGVSTGKWYWEGRRNAANVYHCQVAVASSEVSPNKLPPSNTPDNQGSTVGYWGTNLYKDGVAVQTVAASGNGDIIGLALDLDSTPNTVTFTKNGSALGTAVSVTSGFTWIPCEGSNTSGYTPTVNTSHNFGQDGTMAGLITAGGNSDANGIGDFKYSVPSGHLAVCTKNVGS
jgi:hypothetical protein